MPEFVDGIPAAYGTGRPMQTPSAVVNITGDTIPIAYNIHRSAPAGAITGVIVQKGTIQGQELTIINESANSITFATQATSNVADGASSAIAALTARKLIWDSATGLWYRAG